MDGNYSVAAVQPAASNSPPDCCICFFESPTAKTPPPEWVVEFLVTRRGFEPRTHCLKGKALILRAGWIRKPVAALALFDLVCVMCMSLDLLPILLFIIIAKPAFVKLFYQ